MDNMYRMGEAPDFDAYEISELDSPWSQQLDTVGMQPHSREYLERSASCYTSWFKLNMITGEQTDYPKGIHFGGTP